MLLSEIEERGRRFKLALRAGIPILLLVGLIFYAVFLKDNTIKFTLENSILMGAIIFISVYFIYFLLELDAQETLIDHQTHGFNQKAFEEKLVSSKSKTIALLIINNLSSINENYGMREGDMLLYQTIQRLNHTLEVDGFEKVIIGRRYGAEFLIAMNEKRDDLRSTLNNFILKNSSVNNIDIEYKFSLMTYSNEELEKTIIHLKDEIISAKTNKTVIEEKSLQDVSSKSKIEASIISAIKKKRLSFSFRPLLNLATDQVDIYEVAIKMKSNESVDILPRDFLPIVNRLGLGREYDLAIVQHLIQLLPLLDNHIALTFNISPFSLRNKDFQDKLFTYLNQKDIDNSRLIIELYERKTHHDLSNYFQTLNYMRAKGLRITIDNFGSSNASMEYMKHFRFDMVQFDRDYVTKIDNPINYEMLHSLIKMSKNLHITTIAKWVDNEKQKEMLKTLGIDYVQGFGIGKPINEKDLINTYN